MPKFLLLVAALGLATAAAAQPSAPPAPDKPKPGHPATAAALAAAPDWSLPYAATITPEALKADLSVLASDAYEGRETGQKGQKMAADYIAKAFAAAGLAGPVPGSDNPFIQHFQLNRTSFDAAAATLAVGGEVYHGRRDFYAALEAPFESPLRIGFAGYGIKEKRFTDYTGAQGRDVVVLLGEPTDEQGRSLVSADGRPSAYAACDIASLEARVSYLSQLRPRSLILVLPDTASFAQVPQKFKDVLSSEHLAFSGAKAAPELRILFVRPEVGARLLGTTAAGLAQYRQQVSLARKVVASPFRPVAATVQTAFKTEVLSTENVLGYLEGSDKKEEMVVVSAHYDHLGLKNGVVFNGADDDGSGTVSVLAMARAFAQAKKDGHGPRRSILFLANTGEEEGLLGSEYYTEHPVFPLKNTVANLNIDMVGRVDKEHEGKGDYVYLVGDDKLSSQLHTLSEATNQQYSPVALDYKYNDPADPEHIYYRSDHYNFAKHKVPVIFYTSGLHPDYHQETDDVDKIDFPAMARRDQLVFHTAWALAQRDKRVVVDSAKP
jgi:hypothetical protein